MPSPHGLLGKLAERIAVSGRIRHVTIQTKAGKTITRSVATRANAIAGVDGRRHEEPDFETPQRVPFRSAAARFCASCRRWSPSRQAGIGLRREGAAINESAASTRPLSLQGRWRTYTPADIAVAALVLLVAAGAQAADRELRADATAWPALGVETADLPAALRAFRLISIEADGTVIPVGMDTYLQPLPGGISLRCPDGAEVWRVSLS